MGAVLHIIFVCNPNEGATQIQYTRTCLQAKIMFKTAPHKGGSNKMLRCGHKSSNNKQNNRA